MRLVNPDQIYNRPSILALIGLSLGCLLLGFFLNFSFEEKILALAQTQLKKNAPCPLKYDHLEVLYFFPGVQFKKLKVPTSCMRELPFPLQFDEFNIQIKGFSFTALAPILAFKGTSSEDLHLRGDILFSPKNPQDFNLHLQETRFNAQLLSSLLSNTTGGLLKAPLQGTLNVNTRVTLQKGKLHGLWLNLLSDNFKISTFQVMGISIPATDIGNLQITMETTGDGKKLLLKKIALGGQDSSLEGNLQGEITLNDDFMASLIKAKAQFSIAPNLLEKGPLSLVKVALNKFHNNKDGLYHVGIDNTIKDMKFNAVP